LAAALVFALLPGAGIAGATNNLDQQLIQAAAFADLGLVKSLLSQGVDVNAKPRDGWTPLMATAAGRYWAVVKVLPQMEQRTELVPAFESGFRGRAEVAQLLLVHGADVNSKDKDGGSALSHASRTVQTDVVSILLANGADPNASDNYGRTPLMFAVDNAGADVVKLLLEKGADVNVRDGDGRTVLMRAASFGRNNIPAIYFSPLRKDIDSNTDWTKLQEAGRKLRGEVVKLLEEHGATE
jgi:ankyrin repeat protein